MMMTIAIDQGAALRAVARVRGAVERRSTIPILANVLLSGEGDQLRITSTDLDVEASEVIECMAAGDGQTTVPSAMLHDILRNASPGDVALTLGATDPRMRVTSGRSRYSLPVLPSGDFPRMAARKFTTTFQVPAPAFRAMLETAVMATAKAQGKPFAEAVRVWLTHGSPRLLRAVATNGHSLARAELSAPEGLTAMEPFLLHTKAVNAITRLLASEEGAAEISLSEALLHVKTDRASITSKLLDIAYPDTERVIPADSAAQALLPADDLALAVRRAIVVSSDAVRVVRLSFSRGAVAIAARGAGTTAEGATEIEIDYDGPAMAMGFNAALLLDILGELPKAEITMGLGGEAGPSVFVDQLDPSRLFILMPLRV